MSSVPALWLITAWSAHYELAIPSKDCTPRSG
jgi:hypothetical protein